MQFYNQIALNVGKMLRWKKTHDVRDKAVNYGKAFQPDIAINLNRY